uniref:Endoplasmic reticulum transmembrane protein n=1 Tax=Blastobotrys adeninivorans TaxID=409370 RepID=A0A060SW03_BLAAD
MTLYYTLVFLILVSEMALFLLLVSVPRKINRKAVAFLHDSPVVAHLKLTVRFTFAFILILFIDSVNRVYKVQAEVATFQEGSSHTKYVATTERSEIQARKFYSQRNMYLCGFTLFLSLILNRTYALDLDLIKAEDTIASLKGHSDSSVKASALSSEEKSEIARLEKALKQKDEDIATLKKQSEGLSKEYMDMADKYNEKEGVTKGNKKTD